MSVRVPVLSVLSVLSPRTVWQAGVRRVQLRRVQLMRVLRAAGREARHPDCREYATRPVHNPRHW